MSVPRLLLIPTHRTGLADAVAAAVCEVLTAQGRQARYHHIGPLAPIASWDSSGGAVFIDPSLTGERVAVGLYDVAVRNADVSLLSSSSGLLDQVQGIDWAPVDLAESLDCPVVVVLDCRGWGTGLRIVTKGIKAHLRSVNLAGAILSGVTDPEHYEVLKGVMSDDGIRVVGCLYSRQGLDWDSTPPGPWGLPLAPDLLDAVAKGIDMGGLLSLAGQRGFLAASHRLSDHSDGGPEVVVASGTGFTTWSRDSVEVLRSAGARVRRLDLLGESAMPAGAAGLVLAGTLWPDTIQEISMNTALLGDIAARVRQGMPTVAMGGGMMVLLSGLQDTLGRSSEMAGVVPAQGEILWDLADPAYVEGKAVRDSVLFSKGEKLMGWALSEVELAGAGGSWETPLVLRGIGTNRERMESFGNDSLLCTPAMFHLAVTKGAAARFVRACEAFAASGMT